MKYTRSANMLLLSSSLALTGFFMTSVSIAAASGSPYKYEMKRVKPDSPLRKSTIMAYIKKKHNGRILSIVHNSDNGPDCHILKLMGEDGEYRIIHVACNS